MIFIQIATAGMYVWLENMCMECSYILNNNHTSNLTGHSAMYNGFCVTSIACAI